MNKPILYEVSDPTKHSTTLGHLMPDALTGKCFLEGTSGSNREIVETLLHTVDAVLLSRREDAIAYDISPLERLCLPEAISLDRAPHDSVLQHTFEEQGLFPHGQDIGFLGVCASQKIAAQWVAVLHGLTTFTLRKPDRSKLGTVLDLRLLEQALLTTKSAVYISYLENLCRWQSEMLTLYMAQTKRLGEENAHLRQQLLQERVGASHLAQYGLNELMDGTATQDGGETLEENKQLRDAAAPSSDDEVVVWSL